MEILFGYVLKTLAFPPGINLLLLAAGLVVHGRRRRTAVMLAGTGFLSLWLLAVPAIATALAGLVEAAAAPVADRASGAPQAIVVLGGGRRADAPEFGGDTVSSATLERLRYGAILARRTGLPVLVTGGRVFGRGPAEADLMAGVLDEEFGVPVRWRETASRNTAGNALESARLLEAEGVRRILLVTHALHMPRAVRAFAAAGLEPLAAPTGGVGTGTRAATVLDWLPDAGALALSRDALHEVVGMLWYRLRYGFTA